MTPDEVRGTLAQLQAAREEFQRAFQDLQRLVERHTTGEDPDETAGVRQPLMPRGPAPRTSTVAVSLDAD